MIFFQLLKTEIKIIYEKFFWPKSADDMPRTLTIQNISDIFLELLDHRVCIFQYQSSFFTLPLIFLIHDRDILLTTKPVSCCIFYYFLTPLLILFNGDFVQIIKYFLRSVLHWRFSRNSVRYKDFTTHNHANEFVRELLVFFAAIPRNLVHNFLWHTIWKAKVTKVTIVGKGCIKERKWANPIAPPRQGYFLSPW